MRGRCTPQGVTLVELMVVLVLLGVLAGVVGLTLTAAPHPSAVDAATAAILAARDSAVRSGRAVTISVVVSEHVHDATALPDGRVITDAPAAIDPLSGSVRDSAR